MSGLLGGPGDSSELDDLKSSFNGREMLPRLCMEDINPQRQQMPSPARTREREGDLPAFPSRNEHGSARNMKVWQQHMSTIESPSFAHHHHPEDAGNVFTVAEGSKSRWSHIDDLDSFFKKVYRYHQKNGFWVMMIKEVLELLQFVFIMFLVVYMYECVDYQVLFRNEPPNRKFSSGDKIYLDDVLLSPGTCAATKFSSMTWLAILVATVFWTTCAIPTFYHFFQYWDIRSFYNIALRISDAELDSFTWHEIKRRLIIAQEEYLMCIHKEKLSELDIYHRILRFKNYMVALVNKDLLPVKINVPLVGETVMLSQGLLYNLELLFFKSPWAPFNRFHLKEDYKKSTKKRELVDNMRYQILLLALMNFFLMPVILFWRVLQCFFNYAELIKREPGSLGVRKWSLYGQLYLRHFNELDHELKGRLNRAYKPANKYLELFVTPMTVVIAQNLAFCCAALLAVLIMLSLWDEDVLNVEHMLTLMTALGSVVAASRIFIPNENMVFCPEKSLTSVMAHIHYFPDDWKGQAHTRKVMEQLGQLFPYTAIYLVQELISPVITPFVLMFCLRPRAAAIIDFFRNFTVEVTGVGDVCSFAQMDVRRHGNPSWQGPNNTPAKTTTDPLADNNPAKVTTEVRANQYTQAEDGKTEMSLVHFTLTNPDWKPPEESEGFISALRGQAREEAEALPTLHEDQLGENCLLNSIHSLEAAGGIYSNLANSLLNEARIKRGVANSGLNIWSQAADGDAAGLTDGIHPRERLSTEASSERLLLQSVHQGLSSSHDATPPMLEVGRGAAGGPIGLERESLNASGTSSHLFHHPHLLDNSRLVGTSTLAPPPNVRHDLRRFGLEYSEADMSFSALYFHEMHHRGSSLHQRRPPATGNTSRIEFNQQSQHDQPQRQLQQLRRASLNELDEENLPLLETGNSSGSRLSSSDMV